MKGAIGRSLPVVLLALPAVAIIASPRPWQQETFWMAIVAWLAVALSTLGPRPPLPRSGSGRLAIGGLAVLAALTATSLAWVGTLEPAADATVLVLLYTGVLVASFASFGDRATARLVEPGLLATIAATALWAMSERVFPGLVDLDDSPIALGRLTEPLGYWNALGALCGLGLVLAATIPADRSRSRPGRVLAASLIPLLATATWLSFSRGALAATLAGLTAAVALGRTRAQAATCAGAAVTLGIAALALEPLEGVRDLTLAPSVRESDGAVLGLGMLALSAIFALVASLLVSRAGRNATGPRPLSRPVLVTASVVAILLAVAPFASVLAGQSQSSPQEEPSGAAIERLASAETLRTRYWDVAIDLFRSQPLIGQGAGSFREEWLRERREAGQEGALPPARNAHSLVVETLGELGLAGLASLLAFAIGVGWCCRRLWRFDRALAVGPAACLTVAASHAAVDWDWQVPGLMISVMLLAGLAIAGADRPAPGPGSRALRAALAIVALSAAAWFGWNSFTLDRYEEGRRVFAAARMLGWTDDRWQRSQDLFELASTANPDASPLTALILAARESGHPRDALSAAERLVDANPESWLAWWLLARQAAEFDPDLAARAQVRASKLRSQRLHR